MDVAEVSEKMGMFETEAVRQDEEIKELKEELAQAEIRELRNLHDGALLKHENERLKAELSKAVATIRVYEETLNARLDS